MQKIFLGLNSDTQKVAGFNTVTRSVDAIDTGTPFDTVVGAAFSADGRACYTATTFPTSLRKYDTSGDGFVLVAEMTYPNTGIAYNLSIPPDGSYVSTHWYLPATGQYTTRIHNPTTLAILHIKSGGVSFPYDMRHNQGGSILSVCGSSSTGVPGCNWYDTSDFSAISLSAAVFPPSGLFTVFSPDGATALYASAGGAAPVARVIDVASKTTIVADLPRPAGAVSAYDAKACFSPDGSRVVVAFNAGGPGFTGGAIAEYNTANWTITRVVDPGGRLIAGIDNPTWPTPRLVSYTTDGSQLVVVWDTLTESTVTLISVYNMTTLAVDDYQNPFDVGSGRGAGFATISPEIAGAITEAFWANRVRTQEII
jgi:uncharacterized protein YodC (DUF2158 family)